MSKPSISLFLPSLPILLLLVGECTLYIDGMPFILAMTLASLGFAMIAVGEALMLALRRQGASWHRCLAYVLPVGLWSLAWLPAAAHVREALSDSRNQLQFVLHESEYTGQGEWLLGTRDGRSFTIARANQAALAQRIARSNTEPCSARMVQMKADLFLLDENCP